MSNRAWPVRVLLLGFLVWPGACASRALESAGDGAAPDAGVASPRIPCATSDPVGGIGRLCSTQPDCADLARGECYSLIFDPGEAPVTFCTRRCQDDTECGPGNACRGISCRQDAICLPRTCCASSSDCRDDELCVVSHPGGICANGPCCSDPYGSYTCHLRCGDLGQVQLCPPEQPVCEKVKVVYEDIVTTIHVCQP